MKAASIRLPDRLHRKLRHRSVDNGKSANSIIAEAIIIRLGLADNAPAVARAARELDELEREDHKDTWVKQS
jgi:predicted DNA-binding protein